MSFDRKATFGVFELDLASGELRKSGVKVRLQEQPFQVLKALLERPGEVVSREELQQRLWPDDTFVDFEGGLSTAVQKIRQALGDSSSNPRFVETLPKRGYRFVAPVEAPYRKDEPRPRGLSPALQLALAAAAVVAVGLAVFRTNDVVEHPPPEPLWTPIPLTAYPGRERTPDFSPDGSSPRQRAEFRRQLPEFASVMGWIGRSASVYRLLVRQRNPQRIEDFCLAGVGNRQPCDAGLLIHSIFQ